MPNNLEDKLLYYCRQLATACVETRKEALESTVGSKLTPARKKELTRQVEILQFEMTATVRALGL